MSEERQETVADIAKMMRRNEEVFHHLYWCEYADRIEAAHKRELEATRECPSQVGNAAKMREALSDACYAMFNFLKTQNGGYEEMANALDKAKAVLGNPPRNCDVGTSDEQAKRFHSFCKKFQSDIQGMCSSQCPCIDCCDMFHCLTKWSQMPYEEGGEK